MDERGQLPITQMLLDWSEGDQSALDRMMPIVYSELHRLAHHYMNRERVGHTLQTSALVNEAYLRLVDQRNVRWNNRAHFFAIAAQMMRRILVDYARNHLYAKRGGGALHVSLDQAQLASNEPTAEVTALDEALTKLESIDPQQARVVELRFFGGLTIKETATALGISVDTVKREWSTAKAWLYREMRRNTTHRVH
ncbi:MAG: sigma-70 family RNA polymerase sigma factor [Pyrinomonadaceae bacterium]